MHCLVHEGEGDEVDEGEGDAGEDGVAVTGEPEEGGGRDRGGDEQQPVQTAWHGLPPQCPCLHFDTHAYAAVGSTSAAVRITKNHSLPNRSITSIPTAYTAPS